MTTPTPSQKLKEVNDYLDLQLKLHEAQRFEKYKSFRPYLKQKAFYALGAIKKERMLNAGNQVGKSEAGSFEMAMHLTGLYPAWWVGRRWSRPIRAWACGESTVAVRDIQQNKLLGPPGVVADQGTGMIPKDAIVDVSTSRGATDAIDTIQVAHYKADSKGGWVQDGTSTVTFKSYEQGRKKFQGEPMDLIWLDEEPPMDVYTECLARLTATGGMLYVTFTPLQGRTALVVRFFDEENPDRAYVRMGMQDADHIKPEDIPKLLAQYPVHERAARSNGDPMLGSGAVFPYPMEMISEPAIDYIPAHWVVMWGIDFGIGHPFAAALMLYDRDNDVIHIHHCYKQADAMPVIHARNMKQIGAAVPVAWPQDGTAREKSGETVSTLYKKEGLLMLPEHATWPDGGIGTEAGILEMGQRMETGRFKVASHLSEWWAEYQNYHRKDGLIVKVNDDLMSATRICVMAKRHARAVPLGSVGGKSYRPNNGEPQMARGVDYDLFSV